MILLVIFLLLLAISAISVASQQVRLNNMASELTRFIEIRGQTDTAVDAELERLKTVTGMDVICTIEGEYIPSTSRIQFGNSFKIVLRYDGKIGVGGIINITIPLRAPASGRSERYWN